MKPGDTIVDKYVLKRRLARGGMGEVWCAWHRFTQRDFAIKLLLPELAHHPEARSRFFHEAEVVGQLRHPSIIQIYDVGQTETEHPFLVMELLEGESLAQRIERSLVLEPFEVCHLFAQAADALQVAHARGVVHRDLSASNLFLARMEGQRIVPKILDFGVSKTLIGDFDDRIHTANGAILGSPTYMSPEQARGAGSVDERTDIWALGVQMYESLSGAPPFRAANYNALMVDIMLREHRPLVEAMPGTPKELAALVERCLIKDYTRRDVSAGELAQELQSLMRRYATSADLAKVTPKRRASDILSTGSSAPQFVLHEDGETQVSIPAQKLSASKSSARVAPQRRTVAFGRSRLALAAASAFAGAVLGGGLSGVYTHWSNGTASSAQAEQQSAALSSELSEHRAIAQPQQRSACNAGDDERCAGRAKAEAPVLVESLTRKLGIDQSIRPKLEREHQKPNGNSPSKTRQAPKVNPEAPDDGKEQVARAEQEVGS